MVPIRREFMTCAFKPTAFSESYSHTWTNPSECSMSWLSSLRIMACPPFLSSCSRNGSRADASRDLHCSVRCRKR